MKYAFSSGAAGGIAGAIVDGLDKKGDWTVFAGYHHTPIDMSKYSERIIPVYIDVTDQASCDAAADEIRKHVDHLDAIVNVSGWHTMGSLVEDNPSATVEKIININCLGYVRTNQALFPLAEKCKGRIINFSSECGFEQPQPFNAPYAISKFAVEAYTIGLRRELAFLGMKVIKIQPGSFKTGMHSEAWAGYDKILETTSRYADVLNVLKPMMSVAMAHPHDLKHIVNCTVNAMETSHPKTNYRCKTTWYLRAIDPIPPKVIDAGYKYVVGGLGAIAKKIKK